MDEYPIHKDGSSLIQEPSQGHMARECASPWDMGAGGKGGKAGKGGGTWGSSGKGYGKAGKGKAGKAGGGKGEGQWGGKAKGEGKGKSKGKGKGYQGYCYDCGAQGHKRGEYMCPLVSGAPRELSLVEWWPESEVKGQAEEGEKSVNVVEFGGGTCARWDLCAVEVNGAGREEPAEKAEESGWKVVRRRKRGKQMRRQGEEEGLRERSEGE